MITDKQIIMRNHGIMSLVNMKKDKIIKDIKTIIFSSADSDYYSSDIDKGSLEELVDIGLKSMTIKQLETYLIKQEKMEQDIYDNR